MRRRECFYEYELDYVRRLVKRRTMTVARFPKFANCITLILQQCLKHPTIIIPRFRQYQYEFFNYRIVDKRKEGYVLNESSTFDYTAGFVEDIDRKAAYSASTRSSFPNNSRHLAEESGPAPLRAISRLKTGL